jgi:hypothetical protein
VQHGRGHLDAVEEQLEVIRDRLRTGLDRGVARELCLVEEAVIGKKVDPRVCPWVGLRSASNSVIDGKAKSTVSVL